MLLRIQVDSCDLPDNPARWLDSQNTTMLYFNQLPNKTGNSK